MKAIRWLAEISVGSAWAGFWACIRWDTARRLQLVETLQPWLKEVLGG